MGNHLYYGDNLQVLRESIQDESVDLIYLDPPFNSNASYNHLFKDESGNVSGAQIEAFDDTWHWDDMVSGEALREVRDSPYQEAAAMLDAMVGFLGKNQMTAYLTMMGVRLIELHRVLKPTGSLYLHCDPTASHYLKIVLDTIFSAKNFRSEVHWYYYNKMHDDRKKLFAAATDTLLFYVKDRNADFVFHALKEKREKPVRQLKRVKKDGKAVNARDEQGNLIYQIKDDKGIDNVWRLPMLQPASPERLGYPTQKPVALLERIIAASSKPGDVVLDPFCGCGTTIHAAQKLDREWIGIDVTHLAISLIETRLYDAFGSKAQFTVHGVPQDVAAAQDLFDRDDKTKKEFEKWACRLIKAYPQGGGKKGADGGIDGIFRFGPNKENKAIVSVKGGKNVGVGMVRDLDAVVTEQKAQIGVLLTLHRPTKKMVEWARGAGTFEVEGFDPVPRIQIVTIEDALQKGPRAVDTPLRHGDTYKQAPREADTSAQGKLDL